MGAQIFQSVQIRIQLARYRKLAVALGEHLALKGGHYEQVIR